MCTRVCVRGCVSADGHSEAAVGSRERACPTGDGRVSPAAGVGGVPTHPSCLTPTAKLLLTLRIKLSVRTHSSGLVWGERRITTPNKQVMAKPQSGGRAEESVAAGLLSAAPLQETGAAGGWPLAGGAAAWGGGVRAHADVCVRASLSVCTRVCIHVGICVLVSKCVSMCRCSVDECTCVSVCA